MTSEQEMAEMERMSSDWRPDAPVMTIAFYCDFATSPDQILRDL